MGIHGQTGRLLPAIMQQTPATGCSAGMGGMGQQHQQIGQMGPTGQHTPAMGGISRNMVGGQHTPAMGCSAGMGQQQTGQMGLGVHSHMQGTYVMPGAIPGQMGAMQGMHRIQGTIPGQLGARGGIGQMGQLGVQMGGQTGQMGAMGVVGGPMRAQFQPGGMIPGQMQGQMPGHQWQHPPPSQGYPR